MNSIEELSTEQSKNDINSKIFYKISFSIKDEHLELDLLWELVLHIKRWLESKERKKGIIHVTRNMRHWTHFKNGNKLYDTEGRKTFYAESIYRVNPENENDISWACRIRECQNERGFAPRWWTTEVGFQTRNNGAARLTFVVLYADAMGFIGECLPAPDISVPGIVRNIQRDGRFKCEVNDDPLSFEAMELYPGQGPAFKEQIYDKERGIPIILMMPQKDSIDKEKVKLPVDPQKMIESVAGNALVYYSNEMSFVDEMRYFMDEDYRCTAGMIRYYLPNVDTSNPLDANRHRFIHYDEVVEKGEASILRIFRRVVAQDINDYDNLFRYRNCEEMIRRDALHTRFVELKKKHEESSQFASTVNDDLKSKLEKMELEKIEFEFENSDLKDELQKTKNDNYGLQSQLETIQAAYEPLKKGKEAYDLVRQIDEYPKSPEDVLEFFTTVFADRIDLTEKGWKSLKECGTSLAVLWEVLFSMVTTLYDCLGKYSNFVEACKKYNEQVPFECVPGNSSTTKKDKTILREYEDHYCGKEINIEPHIKSNSGKESDSRFFRIYFANFIDSKTGKRKVVIGSCGGHMTTAGTMHKK
ncbi:MAG TPA: hypothetical protein DD634_00660 [Lachnospiraceae bacterium]|nr:hypothetical protein [Lachnospiraceae bacterium]HBW55589.1 hypothetical protein [Lachnospiraceae bacterium]